MPMFYSYVNFGQILRDFVDMGYMSAIFVSRQKMSPNTAGRWSLNIAELVEQTQNHIYTLHICTYPIYVNV